MQNFTLGTATSGAITGTVTDSGSHAPIAGVSVTCSCSANTATTDSNGHYAFQGLAPSPSYSLQFSDDGYTTQNANVSVNVGQTTTENVSLRNAR